MHPKYLFRTSLALGSLAATESGLFAQQAVTSVDTAMQRMTLRQSSAKADQDGGDNLDLGFAKFDLKSSLGVMFQDNIDFSPNAGNSDVIVRPGLSVAGKMPLSQRNTLSLSLDFGYNAYFDNTSLNFFDIRAGQRSELAMDFFVGDDWTVTVFDRPSISQDPVDSPQVSGVADFGRIENTVGIVGLKQLANFGLTLGYEHYNYWALATAQQNLDRVTEIAYVSFGFKPSDVFDWAIDISGNTDRFDQNNLNDAYQINAGPRFSWKVSEYFSFNAGLGITYRDHDAVGTIGDTEDATAPYSSVGFSHRVNERLSHNFNFARTIMPGTASNFLRTSAFNENISFQMSEKVTLRVPLSLQMVEESGGGQDFNRYQVGLTFGFAMGPQVMMDFGYQYLNKDVNNRVGLDYKQHRLMSTLTYDF